MFVSFEIIFPNLGYPEGYVTGIFLSQVQYSYSISGRKMEQLHPEEIHKGHLHNGQLFCITFWEYSTGFYIGGVDRLNAR